MRPYSVCYGQISSFMVNLLFLKIPADSYLIFFIKNGLIYYWEIISLGKCANYLLSMGMMARENIVNIHSLDRGNIIKHWATPSHATSWHRNTVSYSCSSGEQVPVVKTWKWTVWNSICTSPSIIVLNFYDALVLFLWQ